MQMRLKKRNIEAKKKGKLLKQKTIIQPNFVSLDNWFVRLSDQNTCGDRDHSDTLV